MREHLGKPRKNLKVLCIRIDDKVGPYDRYKWSYNPYKYVGF